jgi:hypothetical protein
MVMVEVGVVGIAGGYLVRLLERTCEPEEEKRKGKRNSVSEAGLL